MNHNNRRVDSFLLGKWMKHPLHGALVHLPVGLWAGNFFFDIAYLVSDNRAFLNASYYCLVAAILTAIPAAITGLAEFTNIRAQSPAKRIATVHMVLNAVVLALSVVNLLLRNTMTQLEGGSLPWVCFALTVIGFSLLGVSGFLGGLMVYQHGLGQRRGSGGPVPNEEREAA